MEDKLYNQTLRFLSYRVRSEKEVRDNLKKKKAPQDVIEKIIAKLKKYKFINDEEFAKLWIEGRLRSKPRSLRLIKIELKQKGIDSDLMNNLIESDSGENDFKSAKKLAEKRIGRLKGLPRQEVYQKLGRYLASKGYDWDTVKKAIDYVQSPDERS
jgi:regulatory protein